MPSLNDARWWVRVSFSATKLVSSSRPVRKAISPSPSSYSFAVKLLFVAMARAPLIGCCINLVGLGNMLDVFAQDAEGRDCHGGSFVPGCSRGAAKSNAQLSYSSDQSTSTEHVTSMGSGLKSGMELESSLLRRSFAQRYPPRENPSPDWLYRI